MNTIITYPTAYSFWMQHDAPKLGTSSYLHEADSSTMKTSEDYYEFLAQQMNLKLPLHLLFSDSNSRVKTANTVCHVMPGRLPQTGFVEVLPSVWVISPAMCFLFSARDLSVPSMVLAANNLCGTYYYENEVHKQREPLVTVSEIALYLENISGVAGIKKARKAISYALNRSNSPVESKLAAEGRLPLNRGGFALLKPALNDQVTLSLEAQELLRRKSCICDMVWEQQKVIVEYDSKQFHLEEEQFIYDKKRTTALNLSGYKVISVTNNDIINVQKIEELFLMIRHTLGVRPRQDRLEKYRDVRRQTIKELFFTREIWMK